MSAIEIRPVRPWDLPAISAIYGPAVESGTASFELEPPTLEEMASRMRQITEGGFPYLVAEWNGRVAGYAYANTYRTRPAYRYTVEDSIYVDPALQGQGIGAALLARLIAESEARGFRQMIAVIGDSLQVASIALHRRAGFTFCGTLHAVGFKFGRWIDSVHMQRPLGEGESTPAS